MQNSTWKTGPILEQLISARAANMPFLAIQTPDTLSTYSTVVKKWRDSKKVDIIVWDAANGARGLNDKANEVLQEAVGTNPFTGEKNDIKSSTLNPVEFCTVLGKCNSGKDRDFIAFAHNLHRFMLGGVQSDVATATVTQAVLNLRDVLKKRMSMLVILGGVFNFSPDIAACIEICEDKYPDAGQIVRQVQLTVETNKDIITEAPTSGEMEQLVAALRGLTLFTIDQTLAVNIRDNRIDVAGVWETKYSLINQTRGLYLKRDETTFDQIGGCKGIKDFMTMALNAKRNRPRMVVYIDEVEKQMAGSGGGRGGASDSSGVSQGVLGALLTFMEDKNTRGVIFVGHPGNGKSQIAKAAGSAAELPVIELRLSDLKSSLVGSTEENTRVVLNMLEAMSDGQIMFVATSNNIESLAPEFRARFSLGQYMFEFPSATEREQIFKIWCAKNEIEGDGWKEIDATDWTGREIKNCCNMVADYGLTFADAARKVVPVSKSGRENVARLRQDAAGRYLSAETGEVYVPPSEISGAADYEESGRRINRRD